MKSEQFEVSVSADVPVSLRRRTVLAGLGVSALLAACAGPHTAVPATQFNPARRMGPTLWDQPSSTYRFERLNFTSADGGRRYRVWLAMPRGKAPAAGHPLLVMTDGNAVADTLTTADLDAAARAGDAPVIVAIGPDSDLRFDVVARAYDYTPKAVEPGPTYDDESRGRLGGGADAFLDLIEHTILPAVATRAAIDPARRTLWGHSYGGLLVLHTVFRRPAMFTRYAAADPSLWWHRRFIMGEAIWAVLPPEGYTTTLLIMAGTGKRPRREGADAQTARARNERESVSPEDARRFAEDLSQRPNLAVRYREFPTLTHGPMFAASIPPALLLAASR